MCIQVEASGQQAAFTLTKAETLVLMDFLVRFDQNGQPDIRDQAEQLLFWHLLTSLKRAFPDVLTPDYPQKIATARQVVLNSA